MSTTSASSRHADTVRANIVRTAARLFDEKGYHATGMDDIAAAIGLRKPTLYYYVTSKAEIVVWIHNDVMAHVLDNLERNVADGIDPINGLRGVITDILEIMATRPGYLRVFFEHHREIPEPLRTETIRKRDRYQSLVESLIQDGIQRGQFRQVHVRTAAFALFGMTNWSYQWYQPGGEFTYRDIADELLTLYLTGMTR